MLWLLNRISQLLQSAAAIVRRGTRLRERQEDIYESPGSRAELIRPLHLGKGHRTRKTHVIGTRASDDGIGWDEEELKYVENGSVQTRILYREVRRCDCGAVLAYTNNVLGTCTTCSRVICKEEGCGARCKKCGALVCKRHSVKLCEHTFCSRHRVYGLWLCFWGVKK